MSARGRGYRIEQQERLIGKRRKQFIEVVGIETAQLYEQEGLLADNRFADEQPHLGCRRAHCGMCHSDKHDRARRDREKREWRKREELI
jgi:hypothetical protein